MKNEELRILCRAKRQSRAKNLVRVMRKMLAKINDL